VINAWATPSPLLLAGYEELPSQGAALFIGGDITYGGGGWVSL